MGQVFHQINVNVTRNCFSAVPACEAVYVYSIIHRIHNYLLEDLILFVFQYYSVFSVHALFLY